MHTDVYMYVHTCVARIYKTYRSNNNPNQPHLNPPKLYRQGGIEELKAHPWFANSGLDWSKLKELPAPLRPEGSEVRTYTYI